jgi:hypothetical protein
MRGVQKAPRISGFERFMLKWRVRCLFNKIVIPDAAEAAIWNPVPTEIKNYRRGYGTPAFAGMTGRYQTLFRLPRSARTRIARSAITSAKADERRVSSSASPRETSTLSIVREPKRRSARL